MRNVFVTYMPDRNFGERPLYFSTRTAREWVEGGDAGWQSKGRILLTEKGRERLIAMEAVRSMRVRSSQFGADGAALAEAYRGGELWAVELVRQIRDRRLRAASSAGGGSGNRDQANSVSPVHRTIRVLTGKEDCSAN